MNGPVKLYQTKQIVRHDLAVELPKCMYKLKNIHESRSNNTMVDGLSDHVSPPKKKLNILDQNNDCAPERMAELELRQENILQQLAELKGQLLSIRKELKIKAPTSTTSNIPPSCRNSTTLPDIVINASPNSPPFSLEIVQKLLKDSYNLTVTVYQHSTVSDVPESAKMLANNLANFVPNPALPTLCLRLIWKECEARVELLVTHVPIHGEVNVLRYLSRLTSNRLSYTSNETDSLLDVCHLISTSKNKTGRTKLLQTLNKMLGKNRFLSGNEFGIVDAAAYSAFKQIQSSELTVNLTNWQQRCHTV